jgi:hypothetical protein
MIGMSGKSLENFKQTEHEFCIDTRHARIKTVGRCAYRPTRAERLAKKLLAADCLKMSQKNWDAENFPITSLWLNSEFWIQSMLTRKQTKRDRKHGETEWLPYILTASFNQSEIPKNNLNSGDLYATTASHRSER